MNVTIRVSSACLLFNILSFSINYSYFFIPVSLFLSNKVNCIINHNNNHLVLLIGRSSMIKYFFCRHFWTGSKSLFEFQMTVTELFCAITSTNTWMLCASWKGLARNMKWFLSRLDQVISVLSTRNTFCNKLCFIWQVKKKQCKKQQCNPSFFECMLCTLQYFILSFQLLFNIDFWHEYY